MKKGILLPAFVLIFCINTYSQETKKKNFYASILTEKNFMLNKWFEDKTYNDALESLSSIDITCRLDWMLYNNYGIWGSLGMGILGKAKAIPSDLNLFEEIDLNDYDIENIVKNEKNDGSGGVTVKMMVGILYKYKRNDWIITPYLGAGIEGITSPSLSYTLKENSSDTAYDIEYNWFNNNREDSYTLSSIYFQIKTDKKISNKMNLSLGASYRHYLTRPNFRATIYNHDDHNIINRFHQKGNYIRSMGVTAGITF